VVCQVLYSHADAGQAATPSPCMQAGQRKIKLTSLLARQLRSHHRIRSRRTHVRYGTGVCLRSTVRVYS
jgi:hypothetical protein